MSFPPFLMYSSAGEALWFETRGDCVEGSMRCDRGPSELTFLPVETVVTLYRSCGAGAREKRIIGLGTRQPAASGGCSAAVSGLRVGRRRRYFAAIHQSLPS